MSGLRILIANGDEAMRELLGGILRADGCEVLAVASTDEAISQATQFGPDTVIIETIMPGKIDGLRTAKRIAQAVKCKVFFLEAIHSNLDTYWDGLRREIPDCDILPIPFEKDEALAIVHRRITGWSIAEKRAAGQLGSACRAEAIRPRRIPTFMEYRARKAPGWALMAAFARTGEAYQNSARDPNVSEMGIHWPYILAWTLLALAMIAEGWVVTGVLFVASFMALLAAYIRAEAIRDFLLAKANQDGTKDWLSTKVWRGEVLLKLVALGTVLVCVGLGGIGWLLTWMGRTLPPGAEWFFGVILVVGIGLAGLMGHVVLYLIGWIRRSLKK